MTYIRKRPKNEIVLVTAEKTVERINGVMYLKTKCAQCECEIFRRTCRGDYEKEFHYHNLDCLNEAQRSGKIKEKKEKYFLEKYGVKNPYASEEVKQKKILTYRNRYGVDNPSQNDEIKKKKEKTCLKNYGVKSPHQSEEIKKKIQITCLARYGHKTFLCSDDAREALKKWSVDNYGVEHIMKSDKFKNQLKQTFLEKYGAENPLQVESIKEKVKNTCMKKYGVDNVFKREDCKLNAKLAIIKNAFLRSSTSERQFYELLKTVFGNENVETQIAVWYNKKHFWVIDFYVKSINTYIQFDGVFWHGLDRDFEELKLLAEEKKIFKNILKVRYRDKFQNHWFNKNNLKLVRITDVEFENNNLQNVLIEKGIVKV